MDNRNNITGALAFRYGKLIHDGRIYSYTDSACRSSSTYQADTGKKSGSISLPEGKEQSDHLDLFKLIQDLLFTSIQRIGTI